MMWARILEGGAGSGNFGHAGRVGKVGGSTTGMPGVTATDNEWANYFKDIGLLDKTFGSVASLGFPQEEQQDRHKFLSLIASEYLDLLDTIPQIKLYMQDAPLQDLAIYSSQYIPNVTKQPMLGQYDIETKSIQLSRGWGLTSTAPTPGSNNVGNDAGNSFRHEFGHHLHLTASPILKQEWAAIIEDKSYKYISKVSKYAAAALNGTVKTNNDARFTLQESFAESFCLYSHKTYRSKTLPKAIDYFFDSFLPKKPIKLSYEEFTAQ